MVGRKSKLTPEQWAEIERRLIEGESRRAIGREFGISEAAIREKLAGPVDEIKDVAKALAEAETRLAALPPLAQVSAQTLAAKLRSISHNLASAAEHGAATAHRLNALANSEVGKVDDAKPLESMESLKGVAVLTKLANDSASIALNLLAANKETVKQLNDDQPSEEPEPVRPQLTREEWLKHHGVGA